MSTDFLDQLSAWEVPAPPPKFDAELHDRVNRNLVGVQIADLALHGLPWALAHFALALAGLVRLSITGSFGPDGPQPGPQSGPPPLPPKKPDGV